MIIATQQSVQEVEPFPGGRPNWKMAGSVVSEET
jgi:hypothetical protein